jgi:hypothetical protein
VTTVSAGANDAAGTGVHGWREHKMAPSFVRKRVSHSCDQCHPVTLPHHIHGTTPEETATSRNPWMRMFKAALPVVGKMDASPMSGTW